MSDDLVARLAGHRMIGHAPQEELAWLAARGELWHAAVGENLTTNPAYRDKLVVVLSGHLAIHVDRGFGPRKVMEWGTGDVTGFMPYSRMGKPPGDGVFDAEGDVFVISRDLFPEMIRTCPQVTTILVHAMLDRIRQFNTSDLQDEKMASLGRLSAGLAHELNNPASAATRSARLLEKGLADLEEASRNMGAARLSDVQRAAIKSASDACGSTSTAGLSPIERADREEAFAQWLEGHEVDVDAATLAETDLSLQHLDAMASALDKDALNTALRWLAASCSTHALVKEVEMATARIHDLVAAVKRFTYMDRTAAAEPVDLTTSINDAVTLLSHKARRKSVTLTIEMAPHLPRVSAIGSDLNQVWNNLIDNALDAVDESGHVTIAAERSLDFVIVRVIDDGHGIPEEARHKLFDMFFTTKRVGEGSGLGLDIVRKLVRRNGGDIEFDSRPGRTEFRVTLPAAVK
jgi:signal transduction histidine kinase